MLDRDKRKVEAGKFSHLTTPEAASVDHPDVAMIAFLNNNWFGFHSCTYWWSPFQVQCAHPSLHPPWGQDQAPGREKNTFLGAQTRALLRIFKRDHIPGAQITAHFQMLKMEHTNMCSLLPYQFTSACCIILAPLLRAPLATACRYMKSNSRL